MNDKELNEIMQDHSGEIERGILSADRKAAEWSRLHCPTPEEHWAKMDARLAQAEARLASVLEQIREQYDKIRRLQSSRLSDLARFAQAMPEPIRIRIDAGPGVELETDKSHS